MLSDVAAVLLDLETVVLAVFMNGFIMTVPCCFGPEKDTLINVF
jgi:hypothetical protein